MIIRILEFGAMLVAMTLLLTQMIIPAIRDEKLFPYFRKKSDRQKNDEQYEEVKKRINNVEQNLKNQSELEERISKLEDRKNDK